MLCFYTYQFVVLFSFKDAWLGWDFNSSRPIQKENVMLFLFNLSWIKGCQHKKYKNVTWASKYFRNVTKFLSPPETVKVS